MHTNSGFIDIFRLSGADFQQECSLLGQYSVISPIAEGTKLQLWTREQTTMGAMIASA